MKVEQAKQIASNAIEQLRQALEGRIIYAHIRSIDESIWKSLAVGIRVKFRIAFNIAGPNAFSVSIVG